MSARKSFFDPRRLRALRDEAGLSVGELAEAMGRSEAIVEAWESGRPAPHRTRATVPSFDEQKCLAGLLGSGVRSSVLLGVR